MKTNIKLWTVLTLVVGFLSKFSYENPGHRISVIESITAEKAGETAEADLSWNTVQITCAVILGSRNPNETATQVKYTWGYKCNTLNFFSTQEDKRMPTIAAPTGTNTYSRLVKFVYEYIGDKYLDSTDWILKTTDRGFVVIENLRHFLMQYNPGRKIAVGFRRKAKDGDYLDEKIGYVLSREAVRALVGEGYSVTCREVFNGIDKDPIHKILATCFKALGVEFIDSRDATGGHRFIPPMLSLFKKKKSTQALSPVIDSYYTLVTGSSCCASDFIATSLEYPQHMYVFDFLTQDFQTYKCGCYKDAVSKKLESLPSPKVLCLVNTEKKKHSAAQDINNTWGRKCTHLLFVSDSEEMGLPVLNAGQDNNNWAKLKGALLYAFENYYNKVDWIVLAESDSYVFYDNLINFLKPYDPLEKLIFGCRFQTPKISYGYISSDCTRVLSKAAVKAFVEEAPKIERCKKDGPGNDDIEFSLCLQDVGVIFADSRDPVGKERFFSHSLEYFLDRFVNSSRAFTNIRDNFISKTFYPFLFGQESCSKSVISVNGIQKSLMHILKYLDEKFVRKDLMNVKPRTIH